MDSSTNASLAHLEAAEAAFATLDRIFDASGLKDLRGIVAGYPDMGADGAGQVAASLFMLLEHLIADGRFDREALAVHIRAWRLMLTAPPEGDARTVMLAGLKAIRELYTLPKAA